MSTKYLLPCPCGLEVAVEPTQAGQTVQCACGKQLEVPTMREIAALEPFDASGEAKPSGAGWGGRHGLYLIGTILIALSLAASLYLYVKRPRPLDFDQLSVGQVWQVWEELSRGVDRPPFPDQQYYVLQMRTFYITLCGLALVTLVGILCLVAGKVLASPRHRLRSTNTASSVAPSTDTGSSSR